MKTLKSLLTALLIAAGLNSMAQTQVAPASPPKIYAIVNMAKWCPVCKANGQRAGMVIYSYADKGVSILMNDLTDKKTTASSKDALSKDGLYQSVAGERSTGIVTLVNSQTKKEIKHFSVALPDDQIKKEIESVL